MRAIGCTFACALLACGSSKGAGGGSAGGPASHLLVIHVRGAGQVASQSPAFTCQAQCQQAFDATATAHLTATAAQGSTFKGWLGDCGGAGGCDPGMDADRDVTAVFETNPGPPAKNDARISVAFTGNGSGRVTSTPAGIDCPGSCSMTVQAGTSVSLSAAAAGGSTFAGWGGACSGPGGCDITAAGDTTAWADFETNTPPPPPPPPPLPAQCKDIAPGTPGAPVAVTTFTPSSCDVPMGDATGTAGLQSRGSPHGVTLHIVDEVTGQQKAFTSNYDAQDGTFTPQPDGFSGVTHAPSSTLFSVQYWNHNGNFVASGQTMQGAAAVMPSPVYGGLLLAGDFMWSGLPARHQAWLVDDTGGLEWAHDLAAKGAVFGLGLDQMNRALIITDGGNGASISAQWFDAQGTALTGEFVIIASFTAGQNTWFETGALIGGGLAVRRVDQQSDADGRAYQTSQWLLTVAPGAASAQAAPQWLAARPNTRLALARGGKAYAFLPLGAPGADCAQQVEVLAPDGVSCGPFDATVARGQCRTEDVALGLDGAVMQLLPKALSQANTCAYRWWPGALR